MSPRNPRPPSRLARSLSIPVLSLTVLGACVEPGDGDALSRHDEEILGSFDFIDGTCTASQQTFFRDAGFVARTVVTSPAYEACLRTRIPAQYRRCTLVGGGGADPNVTTAQHIANALAASRSVNDLKMSCDPASGAWGYAGVGSVPGFYGDERFTYGNASITAPTLPYPEGHREVAATVIHENMHQHGYTHGPTCSGAGYDDGVHSMPWLIDQCLAAVVNESTSRCTDICATRTGLDLTSCRTRGRLKLVTALGATTCADAYDPLLATVGALQVRSNQLVAREMLPLGKPWGGTASAPAPRTSDRFLARGDLDPWKPGDELLYEYASTYPDGWYAAGFDLNGTAAERTTFAAIKGYSLLLDHVGDGGTERWLLYRDTAIIGVGRYSLAAAWGSDRPRDELLVRSPDGLGLLALSGNFKTRNRIPFGTVLSGPGGTWTVGPSDQFLAHADLNGDGQLEMVVRNSTRIGILSRNGASGAFAVLDSRSIDGGDGWWDSWNLGTSDAMVASGDFVGDAREEIVIRSPGAVALIGIPVGATTPRTYWSVPWGTAVGAWTLQANDVIRFPGRWVQAGKKSVIVTGTSGLGVLHWTLSGTTATATNPHRTPATSGFFLDPDLAGGFWAYGPTNQLVAMGDFDGDNRDTLVIRSPWGLGVIGPSSATGTWFLHDATATECDPGDARACNDGLFGSWLARANDTVVTTLKDDTGASALILRSSP